MICPLCGSEFITLESVDLGKRYFHCDECDSSFTDDNIVYCEICNQQIIDGEKVILDDMTICMDCAKKNAEKLA